MAEVINLLGENSVFTAVEKSLKLKYKDLLPDCVIVLGFIATPFLEFKLKYPDKKIIIYQLELLASPESQWYNQNSTSRKVIVRTYTLKEWLRGCDLILEYDLVNVDLLTREGYGDKIVFSPLEYSDANVRKLPATEKKYDILFYGAINKSRADFITEAKKHFNVCVVGNFNPAEIKQEVNFEIIDSLYGDYIWKYIAESKIVLNLHFYPGSQEQVRIYELICNGICVLSEKSNHNYFGDLIEEFSTKNEMVSKLKTLLQDNRWKDFQASADRFKKKDFEGGIMEKTLVAVVIYNRFENLERWLNCWDLCDKENAELVVIHNIDGGTVNTKYSQLCASHNVRYIARRNIGFDIGAFQDVCKSRLDLGAWDKLIWVTDDVIPMKKTFVKDFTDKLIPGVGVVCMEISEQVTTHIRTSGFCIRKATVHKLIFRADRIMSKTQCYEFEHLGGSLTLYQQIIKMGLKVIQVAPIDESPLYDTDYRSTQRIDTDRIPEHNSVFQSGYSIEVKKNYTRIEKVCIVTTFDRNYKEAGKVLFNSIKRHTDCTGIDFKVITSDVEVLNEFGKENCHFITEEIKARYKDVKYSKELPVEKYSSSWYRYEIFNMTEYNRVICIDSDCICVQDISYLFSEDLNQYDLISVEDHFVSKLLPPLYSQLETNGWNFDGLYKRVEAKQTDIQPALLVVNKNVINESTYTELLDYANNTGFTYSIDQGILNDFIYQNNFNIKLLPLEWNYQDLYATRCPELSAPNPIIIHCQEAKPFKKDRTSVDERIKKFYDLWMDERNYTGVRKTITRVGKICITTVFDYRYRHAGETLFKSIRHHTDVTGIDFKVITDDPKVIAEWGAENCHIVTPEIKARYANVKYYHDLPKEKYETSWYRYEMFDFKGYDRVICIDSDCICIEDISYLFSEELNQYDLISTEDMIVAKMFKQHIPELQAHGLNLQGLARRVKLGQIDTQPALLVANKNIVNNTWYNKLVKYANETGFTYSVDEGILNDFIYLDNLNVKILPMEWNYMDTYGAQIPQLPVPDKPYIVHCQESKPFKKNKNEVNKKIHKWYDRWWQEANRIETKGKTLVVIIVWNRFENLKLWINCWNQCIKKDAALVVVHNLETNNDRYSHLCRDNGVVYVPRENKGFDIGAFQDVCKERLKGFPNNWENLIWITDDCIPMQKNFVQQYLSKLKEGYLPCYEISDIVKRHIRTTGFMVTKGISKKLTFPKDPIQTREDCYHFEHKGKSAFYEQIVSMGKKPVMVVNDLKLSPLWDAHVRANLNLMSRHEEVFKVIKPNIPDMTNNSALDKLAIKHKSDKSSRYHNYAVKYDKILAPFKETFTSVLEIGVAQGQSLNMWTDYFPKAIIHGADINQQSVICEKYSNRIKFHLIDQSKEAQLKNLEQFSPFDLIIDDGNHFWMEQILTFNTLFPYVKSGGIYIVENTTTSYWKEYKNNPVSPMEYFKTLVDEVNLKGARGTIPETPPTEFGSLENGWHRREDCFKSLPLFDSIQFMNGFIVIYKR